MKERDCPWEEAYSSVSREDPQGKDLEVGTSWFVLEQGKEGSEAELFRTRRVESEERGGCRGRQETNLTGPFDAASLLRALRNCRNSEQGE